MKIKNPGKRLIVIFLALHTAVCLFLAIFLHIGPGNLAWIAVMIALFLAITFYTTHNILRVVDDELSRQPEDMRYAAEGLKTAASALKSHANLLKNHVELIYQNNSEMREQLISIYTALNEFLPEEDAGETALQRGGNITDTK